MKKFIKIMLIIILLLVITMCILPNVVRASEPNQTDADDIMSNVETYVNNGKDKQQEFMDTYDMTTASILGTTKWISRIFWILFIFAAIVGAWICVIPVIKGIIFGTGAAGAWRAFVIYIVILALALIVLLNLFPLVVEWM